MNTRSVFAACLCLAILGCETRYALKMTPKPDGLDRTFQQTVPAPEQKAEQPQTQPAVTCSSPAIHAGKIATTLPSELGGGAGYYLAIHTQLGSAYGYAERFKRSDDLYAGINSIEKSSDQLTDLIIAWLSSELANEKNFQPLRQFLDTDFRRDIRNMSLHLTLAGSESDFSSLPARMLLYAAERGYVMPEELPPLIDGNNELAGPIVQRIIARRMGLPDSQPIPPCLDFLKDVTSAKDSLTRFLKSSPESIKMLAAMATKDSPEKREEAEAALKNILAQTQPATGKSTTRPPDPVGLIKLAYLAQFRMPHDQFVDATLAVPVRPIDTNGKWSRKEKQINWNSSIEVSPGTLPAIQYATWTIPDDQFQSQHFGKILLHSRALLDYSLWFKSLNPQRAKEWDQFLTCLQPATLEKQLEAFKFQGPEFWGAGDGVRLIKDAMARYQPPQVAELLAFADADMDKKVKDLELSHQQMQASRREVAGDELSDINSPQSLAQLYSILQIKSKDPASPVLAERYAVLQDAIIARLAEIKTPAAIEALVTMLTDEATISESNHGEAIMAAFQKIGPDSLPYLKKAAGPQNPLVEKAIHLIEKNKPASRKCD